MTQGQTDDVYQDIIIVILEIESMEATSSCSVDKSTASSSGTDQEDSASTSHPTVLQSLIGDRYSQEAVNDVNPSLLSRPSKEISDYRAESTISIDSDPFLWW